MKLCHCSLRTSSSSFTAGITSTSFITQIAWAKKRVKEQREIDQLIAIGRGHVKVSWLHFCAPGQCILLQSMEKWRYWVLQDISINSLTICSYSQLGLSRWETSRDNVSHLDIGERFVLFCERLTNIWFAISFKTCYSIVSCIILF